MKVEMLMPQMGESIAEATILKWLKNVGDRVEKDETILEISTDKVDSEIPAPASGTLVEIKAKQGETVAVKSLIAIIETEAGAAAEAKKPAAAPAETKKDTGVEMTVKTPPAKPAPVAAPTPAPAAEMPSHAGDKFLSPLVRNLAQQHGLSPDEVAKIPGSGAQGRVTKNDVMSYIATRAPAGKPSGAKSADSKPAPRPEYDANGTKVEPFDRMRKLIADHMVRSKATSPHVYSVAEVDMTTIAQWREKNQSAFVKREGYKLSFTPFFLEAVVKALIQFPKINASVENDSLIMKKSINLGCAVALGSGGEDGLIVPVIKNADQLNLTGLSASLNDLAARARNKKLNPDDIQGGTFTVTNPGVFGNIMGLAIINQPQLAILGVGTIKKRVMVVDGMIAIRDMVYLTLTYDHRVIDGAMSGRFLSFITNYLESWDPEREI